MELFSVEAGNPHSGDQQADRPQVYFLFCHLLTSNNGTKLSRQCKN